MVTGAAAALPSSLLRPALSWLRPGGALTPSVSSLRKVSCLPHRKIVTLHIIPIQKPVCGVC